MGKTRQQNISPAHMSVKIEDSQGKTLFSLRGSPRQVYPSTRLFCETRLGMEIPINLDAILSRLKRDWKELAEYEL